MKVLVSLGIFLCLSVGALAQETAESAEQTEQGVEEVTLFKDDGKGKPDNEAAEFDTADSPIHCRIQLSSVKATAVKMNMVAVEAKGLKAGSKVITAAYKTNGKQNIVNFNASHDSGWQPGKYKMDILLDEKLAKSVEFTITEKGAPADTKQKAKTPLKLKSLTSKKKKKT